MTAIRFTLSLSNASDTSLRFYQRYQGTCEMKIRRHSNARSFLDRSEDWLLENEAQNNLILAIANQLLREDHPYEDPIYLATIESDAQVVGCAWRTPPLKLGLTRLPVGSIAELAADVAAVYDCIPAVMDPELEALEFAECWARRTGYVLVGSSMDVNFS
jgi:hypothetical protein